ncbi:MAG: hypothetical protein U0K81_06655 [Paludibacteraceae bacterium]|nr:hypothetical protein [Paludibacteraceae bacterium]
MTTTPNIEYGLFLDISDFVEDPESAEVERAMRALEDEDLIMVSSVSNIEGWSEVTMPVCYKANQRAL